MKQRSLLLWCLLFFVHQIYSQGFLITYPMSTNSRGVLLKEDGGVFSVLGIHSSSAVALGKISHDGTLLAWDVNGATTGTSSWTSDGGFIIARKHTVTSENDDVELAKYDEEGNEEWSTIFGGEEEEKIFSVQESNDGSFYVFCTLWGTNGEDRVFKTNANGEVLWSVDFSLEGASSALVPTQDGGVIAVFIYTGAGTIRYNNLIKLSPDGNVEWQQQENGVTGNTFPQRVVKKANGNFVVAGSYGINNTGVIYLNEYDQEGVLVWSLMYEDPEPDNPDNDWAGVTGITETADGSIIIAGRYDTGATFTTAFLSKISTQGEVMWTELVNEAVLLNDVQEGADGNIYAIGYLSNNGIADLLFLKANNEGVFSQNLLSGRIFQDFATDCINDNNEAPLPHWLVEASGGLATIYASAHAGGDYQMRTQIDDYDVSVHSLSPYWEPCQNNVPLSFTTETQEEILDFPFQPVVICPWLELSILGPCRVRPGATSSYYLNYCNYGTATAINVQLTVDLPAEVTIIEASVPYIQNGQTLIFTLDDVGILECQQIRIRFELDYDTPLNTILCAYAHLVPDDICLPDYSGSNPAIDQHCGIVVASYDPNNKLGNPIGMGDDHIISANEELNYMIQFQNTGTDTAFRVVLFDTLPEQLDIITFRPGASSHPYEVELFGTGIVKFTFDPIALVDSLTNEELSQGFVKFTIDQKEDLPLGTIIENSAAIYFDYNAPVITAPWVYTIGEPNAVQEQELFADIVVYPNPVDGLLRVKREQAIRRGEILVYDNLGRLLLQQELSAENHSIIRVAHLAAGLYFYEIKEDRVVVKVGKFFKN